MSDDYVLAFPNVQCPGCWFLLDGDVRDDRSQITWRCLTEDCRNQGHEWTFPVEQFKLAPPEPAPPELDPKFWIGGRHG